jgi:serine/threonine protein kinase
MVNPLGFHLNEVLYSRKDGVWKIGDFGMATEGTSKQAKTTYLARGTGGYRAPEILREQSTYNNKVDIWAFGCIAYEVLTRERAFKGDFYVMQYVFDGGKSPIQLQPNSAIPNATMTCLNFIVKSTLQIEPLERPSAWAILQLLSCRFERIIQMVPAQDKSRRFICYQPQHIDWAEIRWIPYWYS